VESSLPITVAPFAGRITDVDSHEQMPAQVWVENFGEIARPFAEKMMAKPPQRNPNHANVRGYPGDVWALAADNVWKTKGPIAPGAVDIRRRLDVMDLMAVSRQLMFPTGVGLAGAQLYSAPEDSDYYKLFGDRAYSYGKEIIAANNTWAVKAAGISPRIRPVTPIYGDTPEEFIAITKSLLDRGIRAVMPIAGRLPGGVSPASNALDPFYSMVAEANVALTLHIGTELMFFRTMAWGNAKAFEGFKINDEVSMDPWRLSAMHLAPQNYIATMVTGGVFDRHPTLRVGAIEFGAHWIGPLADMLDLWHDNNQSVEPALFADGSSGRRLPMRPSEYISRNVRVTPFEFEPVGKYIEKYGLEDVYCFSTDYPHVEGGKDPIGSFATSLKSLGPKVLEKFFVTNGELLLPN
jgi:predicted TIM-barrel fold metal-dependent hydrolase